MSTLEFNGSLSRLASAGTPEGHIRAVAEVPASALGATLLAVATESDASGSVISLVKPASGTVAASLHLPYLATCLCAVPFHHNSEALIAQPLVS